MGLDERVLIVPGAELDRLGRFQGFSTEADRYLETLLAPGLGSFRARREIEDDPTFKQIIPYVIFRSEGMVFTYRRGGSGGENRLHRLRSLGVGGHVAEDDAGGLATIEAYDAALRRELDEEIILPPTGLDLPRPVGLINDDGSPVGRVHLGVIHLVDLPEPTLTARDPSLADAEFLPITDLARLRPEFETWSQFCIDALLVP